MEQPEKEQLGEREGERDVAAIKSREDEVKKKGVANHTGNRSCRRKPRAKCALVRGKS